MGGHSQAAQGLFCPGILLRCVTTVSTLAACYLQSSPMPAAARTVFPAGAPSALGQSQGLALRNHLIHMVGSYS